MKKTRSFPQPIPIPMAVIVLLAICTWLLPAGQQIAGLYYDNN